MQLIKTHPIAFGICAFNLILIIILLIVFFYNTSKTATLDILVAPTDSEILINGEKYENGTYKLHPGPVTATISHEGLDPKTIQLNLEEGEITKLHAFLANDGDFSYYWHRDDQVQILRQINSSELTEFLADYSEVRNLAKQLPIIIAEYSNDWSTYTEYRIDELTNADCGKILCLQIKDTTGGNEPAALSILNQKGFDSSLYNVTYIYKPITPLGGN